MEVKFKVDLVPLQTSVDNVVKHMNRFFDTRVTPNHTEEVFLYHKKRAILKKMRRARKLLRVIKKARKITPKLTALHTIQLAGMMGALGSLQSEIIMIRSTPYPGQEKTYMIGKGN